MATSLQDYSLPIIFLVSIVVLLAASEAGRFIGMPLPGGAATTYRRSKAPSSACWR